MPGKWMRGCALVLGLLWACWWVFFEAAEAMGSGVFGQAIIFAVVMLGIIAVAWKWNAIGGALLIAEGIAAIAFFAPMWLHNFGTWQIVGLFAMMPAPPIVAGVLLLMSKHWPATIHPVHAA
jgi:hypothetical protein